MLKRQGSHAQGGAKDYVVDGKMAGGFAFVAYPAEYGNSGIMTFIINQDGVIFQKDLVEDHNGNRGCNERVRSRCRLEPGPG